LRRISAKAEIVGCTVTLASEDVPFGQVKDEKFIIRSVLKEIVLSKSKTRKVFKGNRNGKRQVKGKAKFSEEGLESPITAAYFDVTNGQDDMYPECAEDTTTVDRDITDERSMASQDVLVHVEYAKTWCITFVFTTNSSKTLHPPRQAHGLLLKRARSNYFQRIGRFKTSSDLGQSAWFDDGKLEEITII
jgi:hypothetical protein